MNNTTVQVLQVVEAISHEPGQNHATVRRVRCRTGLAESTIRAHLGSLAAGGFIEPYTIKQGHVAAWRPLPKEH